MFLTKQNLIKAIANIKKECRFCRYESYGGRKLIVCHDNPIHNQVEFFGAGRRGNANRKHLFVPKPETSLSADPFKQAIHKDFGSGDMDSKRNGILAERGAVGIVGWNLAREDFRNQYAWSFNPHRQGGAFQKKK